MARILLVEDNRMDAELTLNALSELPGHRDVYVATDGQEVIDYLTGREAFADRDRFPMPDLILLDLKLPSLDGHQILSLVKSMPLVRRVPVVVFTSSTEERDRAQCYDNGCNSYLEKPHTYDGYVELMQELQDYWLIYNVAPVYSD